MKKTLSIIAVLSCILQIASAEAPELRNMMPNSWQKLARLSVEEEKEFISEGTGKESMDAFKKDSYREDSFDFRVYRETVCGVEFYRLLICSGKLEHLLGQTYGDTVFGGGEGPGCARFEEMCHIRTAQIVFVRGRNLAWKEIWNMPVRKHDTIEPISFPWTDGFTFYDLMIRKLNGRKIGFFTTEAGIGIRVGYGNPVYVPDSEGLPWTDEGVKPFGAYYAKTKGQLSGGSTMYFTKRSIDEEISSARSKDEVRVNASSYLFDPKCPLKYSIQNAFDGNPATSYVENTEDDLMKIDVWLGEAVDKMAIINGYASSEMLYKSNNRVKQVENYFDLKDSCLYYQYIPCRGTNVSFTAIYNGSKYNDTCIAEINYLFKNSWLFGDIDE